MDKKTIQIIFFDEELGWRIDSLAVNTDDDESQKESNGQTEDSPKDEG